jgi:hypothetical protein
VVECRAMPAVCLFLHVVLLLPGPLLVVDAEALRLDSAPQVGEGLHDAHPVLPRPVLHGCAPGVGVDLHVLVREGVHPHAEHPAEASPHDDHDGVRGRVAQPRPLELVVALDDVPGGRADRGPGDVGGSGCNVDGVDACDHWSEGVHDDICDRVKGGYGRTGVDKDIVLLFVW